MLFGTLSLDKSEGALLAHTLRVPGRTIKKGSVISSVDICALRTAGFSNVMAARIEKADVIEDQAARIIAEALCGTHLQPMNAFTGRCNLVAESEGLFLVEPELLKQLNSVDEAVTVATVSPFQKVVKGQVVATIKIIPFAISRATLENAVAIATGLEFLRIAPFTPKSVGLVLTRLWGAKESLLDKAEAALHQRVNSMASEIVHTERCFHDQTEVAAAVEVAIGRGCELVLISGATATVDRRDVVPVAITRAGGTIDHFGMPVDPGNLLLLAHQGSVPVIGVPGCARSLQLNGFDWVLERLLAGMPVLSGDIAGMGAGGLLKEAQGQALSERQPVNTLVEKPNRANVARISG